MKFKHQTPSNYKAWHVFVPSCISRGSCSIRLRSGTLDPVLLKSQGCHSRVSTAACAGLKARAVQRAGLLNTSTLKLQESKQFGVRTKYLRTICDAVLVRAFDAPSMQSYAPATEIPVRTISHQVTADSLDWTCNFLMRP
eukprot:5639640-Amphidinium_carterae.2